MRRLAIWTLLAGVLTIAACSAAQPSSNSAETADPAAPEMSDPSSTSASPSTTAPESTTTVPPVKDPAQRYLELVGPQNCLAARIDEAAQRIDRLELASEVWPAVQAELLPLFGEYATAAVAFYEGLLAEEWPPEVQSDIDALVGELTAVASEAQRLSEVDSLEQYLAFEFVPLSTNSAAIVRAKLGLPSNVTDEADYCTASAA